MNKKTEKPTSASFFQIVKAVLSAFVGIRRKSDHEFDAATLKPHQVIIGGLIGAALFVICVMLLVRLVVN